MFIADMIAPCGLDCETCEARLATVNDDNELRSKVAREWSELNSVEITPEMINCSGCRIDGVKTPYCDSLCPIRFFMSDQAVCERKTDGNLRRLSGNEVVREGWSNYRKQF